MTPHRVHVLTLGCPKNQVDSELMLGVRARRGHELARLLDRDTLLEVELLLRRAGRTRLHRSDQQRLQRHLAAGELLAEDVAERTYLEVVGRVEVDGVLLAADFGLRTLEVEPLSHLAQRLVDRVVDLLQVDAAHDVEGRHRGPLNRRAA